MMTATSPSKFSTCIAATALIFGLGGIGGAAALTQLIRSQLYEVNAIDPLTFVIVALGLIAVTVFACWLPARRASCVDPTKALRYE